VKTKGLEMKMSELEAEIDAESLISEALSREGDNTSWNKHHLRAWKLLKIM